MTDNTRIKIGVIAAMESEVSLLRNKIENMKIETIGGSDYYSGTIGNYDVILMQCGIGKVSAALGAQAMISEFGPDYIINTGCAGALAKGLAIGDMVLGSAAVEWDLDLTALGMPRGFVTALGCVEMKADEKLIGMVRAAIPADIHVVEGLVVSGDQFVSTDAQRDIILGSFPNALCAEMEGAAIGHVCAQNKVPFCVVRCMSDTADGDSDVNFAEFSAKAGEKSADILLKLFNGQA